MFNQQVAQEEALTTDSVLLSPPRQHLLSEKVEKLAFSSLLHNATTATKARLLAESVPQAHAWLRTVPSPGLGLALEPDETHILLKWWLGLPLFNSEETCPYCSSQLDPLGHHALTCRYAGDVVTRHNCIRDCIADFCRRARLARPSFGARLWYWSSQRQITPSWHFDTKLVTVSVCSIWH